MPYLLHGLCSVFCRINPESILLQKLHSNFTVQFIVFHKQDASAPEIRACSRKNRILCFLLLLTDRCHQRLPDI